jgi:hypothetical protein
MQFKKIIMSNNNQNNPQPYSEGPGKKKVVNEQEQLEEVNPGGNEIMQGTQPEQSDQHQETEKQTDMEKGNTYEDDPRKGEGKVPR